MKYTSVESQIRKIMEGVDPNRNTKEREKVVNVGRPDTAESPTSEKSKLAKQGEIKTKIIDEATDKDLEDFFKQNPEYKRGSTVKVGQEFKFGDKTEKARAGEGPYQVLQRLKSQQPTSAKTAQVAAPVDAQPEKKSSEPKKTQDSSEPPWSSDVDPKVAEKIRKDYEDPKKFGPVTVVPPSDKGRPIIKKDGQHTLGEPGAPSPMSPPADWPKFPRPVSPSPVVVPAQSPEFPKPDTSGVNLPLAVDKLEKGRATEKPAARDSASSGPPVSEPYKTSPALQQRIAGAKAAKPVVPSGWEPNDLWLQATRDIKKAQAEGERKRNEFIKQQQDLEKKQESEKLKAAAQQSGGSGDYLGKVQNPPGPVSKVLSGVKRSLNDLIFGPVKEAAVDDASEKNPRKIEGGVTQVNFKPKTVDKEEEVQDDTKKPKKKLFKDQGIHEQQFGTIGKSPGSKLRAALMRRRQLEKQSQTKRMNLHAGDEVFEDSTPPSQSSEFKFGSKKGGIVTADELNKYREHVGNKNVTLGQYMNDRDKLTAKKGGANDPDEIQKKLDAKPYTGPRPQEYERPQAYRPTPRAQQDGGSGNYMSKVPGTEPKDSKDYQQDYPKSRLSDKDYGGNATRRVPYRPEGASAPGAENFNKLARDAGVNYLKGKSNPLSPDQEVTRSQFEKIFPKNKKEFDSSSNADIFKFEKLTGRHLRTGVSEEAVPLPPKRDPLEKIASMNPQIKDPNLIVPGQRIKTDAGEYTVAKGDTLSGISQGKYKGTAPVAPVAGPGSARPSVDTEPKQIPGGDKRLDDKSFKPDTVMKPDPATQPRLVKTTKEPPLTAAQMKQIEPSLDVDATQRSLDAQRLKNSQPATTSTPTPPEKPKAAAPAKPKAPPSIVKQGHKIPDDWVGYTEKYDKSWREKGGKFNPDGSVSAAEVSRVFGYPQWAVKGYANELQRVTGRKIMFDTNEAAIFSDEELETIREMFPIFTKDENTLSEGEEKWGSLFPGSELGSPAAYNAAKTAAAKHGIPLDVVAGIMWHETGGGKAFDKRFNPAGIMDPNTGWKKKKAYPDIESGIDDAVKVMKKNYDVAGGDIGKMGKRYAPPGAENDPSNLNQYWPSGVKTGMQKFRTTLGLTPDVTEPPKPIPNVQKQEPPKKKAEAPPKDTALKSAPLSAPVVIKKQPVEPINTGKSDDEKKMSTRQRFNKAYAAAMADPNIGKGGNFTFDGKLYKVEQSEPDESLENVQEAKKSRVPSWRKPGSPLMKWQDRVNKAVDAMNLPTIGNQQGEKGDQSGHGVKSNVARYSISDERVEMNKLTEDKIKAIVEEEKKRGRGRPKKNPEPDEARPEGRDPRQHIQVIAGQAGAGRHIDFRHDDGSTSKITPPMGRSITAKLYDLKPAARHEAVQKIHGSSQGLKDVMGV